MSTSSLISLVQAMIDSLWSVYSTWVAALFPILLPVIIAIGIIIAIWRKFKGASSQSR